MSHTTSQHSLPYHVCFHNWQNVKGQAWGAYQILCDKRNLLMTGCQVSASLNYIKGFHYKDLGYHNVVQETIEGLL